VRILNGAAVVALGVLVGPPSGLAHEHCTRAECAEVKQEIREIEARMRAGYSRAQGEKYEARLRKLKAKRYKLCR
jgi:hypothetical protein